MQAQPYLFFDGACDDALAFYEQAIGARVLMRLHYRDSPEPGAVPPGAEGKVMHAMMQVGDSTVFCSDGCAGGAPKFDGFGLSLAAADVAEAGRLFGALAEGGAVQMPLAETFFAGRFGMVKDRFGVLWMVLTEPKS